jgi:hypothetical protein
LSLIFACEYSMVLFTFHHSKKLPEIINLRREKIYFWLMDSEVSIHCLLNLWLWAWWNTVHHGRRACGRVKLLTSWQLGSKEREWGWARSQHSLQGHAPNDLSSFHYDLLLKGSENITEPNLQHIGGHSVPNHGSMSANSYSMDSMLYMSRDICKKLWVCDENEIWILSQTFRANKLDHLLNLYKVRVFTEYAE